MSPLGKLNLSTALGCGAIGLASSFLAAHYYAARSVCLQVDPEGKFLEIAKQAFENHIPIKELKIDDWTKYCIQTDTNVQASGLYAFITAAMCGYCWLAYQIHTPPQHRPW